MKMHEIYDGMKVYWKGTNWGGPDTGVIKIGYVGRSAAGENEVWVKWDSDGEILKIDVEELTAVHEQSTEEQQAVMLLLSLGYTISKN